MNDTKKALLFRRNTSYLEAATLVYLASPWFIFSFGWLRPVWAILVSVVLLIELIRVFAGLDFAGGHWFPRNHVIWIRVGAILLIGFIWTRLSGAGGYGFQNWDWVKANAALKDLVFRDWPVAFSTPDGSVYPMVYYVGYFLPAALIGKLSTWDAANGALFVTTLVGAWLSLAWFTRLNRRHFIGSALFFVFVGGLDFVFSRWILQFVPDGRSILGNWSHIWEFQANTFVLFWGPQHAISAWLLTSLILYQDRGRRSTALIALILSIGLLWSPFVVAGLIPIAAVVFLRRWRSYSLTVKNSLGPALLTFFICAYFIAHSFSLPRGWLWKGFNLQEGWPLLLIFYLSEFALFAFFCRKKGPPGLGGLTLWSVVLLTLFAAPLYCIGAFWDLTMRGALAPLFFLHLAMMNSLSAKSWDARTKTLALLALLGFFPAFAEISRSTADTQTRVPDLSKVTTLINGSSWSIEQYIGSSTSFFFKRLAKPLVMGRRMDMHLRDFDRSFPLFVEAENHANHTRVNHSVGAALVHGGRIVDRGFGGSPGDELTYQILAPQKLEPALMSVLYSTALDGASVDVEINGHAVGKINLPSTRSWSRYLSADLLIPGLNFGANQLKIKSNGVNINLDVFIFQETQDQTFLLPAERFVNRPRIEHRQICPASLTGQIIDHDFGAADLDFIDLAFETKNDLNDRIADVLYATKKDGVILSLSLDGKLLENAVLKTTNDWWNFRSFAVYIPFIPAGRHVFRILSNGVNVNLDALTLNPGPAFKALIQAEDYENAQPKDRRQQFPLAMGGKIVGNDFGGNDEDFLQYRFTVLEDLSHSKMILRFATALEGAEYKIQIDRGFPIRIKLPSTGDWVHFASVEVPLDFLARGSHEFLIKSNGVNVNFDWFACLEQ
jgi:hypothetical protein